ncbi:MAG TPA: preprotein translocase subunit SecA [Candidatus Sumerlaeota bacterium]|nr:preprotein translocase subunit SecA [Candidatus Sumerlaeota bacterium]
MLNFIFRWLVGDKRQRNFKQVAPIIAQINDWCERYNSLTDDELKAKTTEFRERLAQGATLDDLLPEAYGAVKQVCRRLVGQSWEAAGIPINWNDVPFDVQLCGAIYLHRGNVCEMATGEGKTLVATMPLYLNALEGKGAHLVTTNDFLARFGKEWVSPVYERLGMTTGVILSQMTPAERREAYNCDITYGTNNEFGFDYLRDNMALQPEHLVQREHHFAIVDEVDSVLIDEARTPLIISGQVDRSTHQFDRLKPLVVRLVEKQNQLVNSLVAEAERLLEGTDPDKVDDRRYEAGMKLLQARLGSPKHKRFTKIASDGAIRRLIDRVENDFMRDKRMRELEEALFFVVDERGHTIDLTELGRQTISPDNPDLFLLPDLVEEFAQLENQGLSEEELERKKEELMNRHEERTEELHNISQLLRAYVLYERDVDYVVQDNKVVIVDEFTGRLMTGRRWSDGLHQAVEAKEGVTIEKETQTLATITLQNYFRMYKKLAGMTGTAETEAEEFAHTYKMDVYVIPTNVPIRRLDLNDLIYRTEREKFNALVQEVHRLHEYGLPVLVGTTSVNTSEKLSIMLRRQKISHSVLNAKQHEREAQIIRQAGQLGAVTIATNMAGRGTDIKLGQGVIKCADGAKPPGGKYCVACPNRPPGAEVDPDMPPCGLQILGSERHEARRIDRQLRGRAGRQGDPGSSRFFVSLEDELMRLFASERMAKLMSKGFVEGEAMSHRIATRALESAQKKIESINFEQRKRTLDYDNVMNKQRERIYGIRREALLGQGSNLERVLEFTGEALADAWEKHCPGNDESEWDVTGFLDWVRRYVPLIDLNNLPPLSVDSVDDYLSEILERCAAVYRRKTEMMGEQMTGALARYVLLTIIDTHWRDHLLAIDELRHGIALRSYGQKDPLTEYQREATLLFEEMMAAVMREIFERIYRVYVVQEPTTGTARLTYLKEEGRQSITDAARSAAAQAAQAAEGQAQQGQTSEGERPARPRTYRREQPKTKPNDPCWCGSGKKYKKCHGNPALQQAPLASQPAGPTDDDAA